MIDWFDFMGTLTQTSEFHPNRIIFDVLSQITSNLEIHYSVREHTVDESTSRFPGNNAL